MRLIVTHTIRFIAVLSGYSINQIVGSSYLLLLINYGLMVVNFFNSPV